MRETSCSTNVSKIILIAVIKISLSTARYLTRILACCQVTYCIITGINDGMMKCYSFTYLLLPVKKPIELKNVYEDLINISNQWYDLGLQLELEEETLKTIKLDNPESQHCLREMLSTWLKIDPRPSWQTLCAALHSRTVGAEKLAGDLEAKYKLRSCRQVEQ